MKPIVRWPLLAAAQLLFLLAGAHLLLGHHGLARPTPLFDLPLGHLLAWTMMFSLPLAAWLALLYSRLARAALALLVLGVIWLPVSMLLAGNVALNFAGGPRLVIWLAYSAACLLGPLVLGLGWLVARMFGGTRGG
jgi:hypothetical protein